MVQKVRKLATLFQQSRRIKMLMASMKRHFINLLGGEQNVSYAGNIKDAQFGMEDGLDGPLSNLQVSDLMKNGVSPIMANFPEGTVTEAKDNKQSFEPQKVNGESNPDHQDVQNNPFQDSYSSESDALVIDESVPKKKRVRGKYNKKPKETIRRTSEKENDSDLSNPGESKEKVNSDKKLQKDIFSDTLTNKTVQNSEINSFTPNISNENTQTSDNFSANNDTLETQTHCDVSRLTSDVSSTHDLLSHSNPFFHESLFELSQLHQTHYENTSVSEPQTPKDVVSSSNRTIKRVKPKPKLQEYAQYLGLQPAVQFKCPKCGKSGFESLLTLQDHFLECNSVQILEKTTENENVSGFKLKRKVFLCSTCGTYYENWNLYLHMLEYHRRYICLYCLGMFSILEDLCQHIQSRHNLEPGIKNTLEDFYNTYNEPCYVICCECNRQFNEGDNFFYHNCIQTKQIAKSKPKQIKQIIAPENHVTGDFVAPPPEVLKESEQIAQAPVIDSERTCSKEDLQENPPEATENLPEISQEGVSNQVDSDKQIDFNEMQKSKESFSESSENGDDPVIKEKTDSAADIIETKPTDTSDRDNIEGNCEQDSLDSTKISEGNLENLASTENTMDSIEDNLSDSREMDEPNEEPQEEPVETRKVPKLSLKLPKPGSYPEPDPEDSDDSEKHGMEIDNIESENENEHTLSDTEQAEEQHEDLQEDVVSEQKDTPPEPLYPAAGVDIPIIEIELDQPLDKMDIRVLLQKCLRATVPSCIYCNHSRRISVNGKQLALHAMAEHRYSAINKGITEEELIPDSFNSRIAECLEQLEAVFFNLESGASEEAVTFSHVFECFQCHYSTTVHKELYLHNRKFHSKNLLLCIMCKSNFYSYSELICHLCPGMYVLDYDLQFRCCMCVSDVLPSSFRLMVHLRKRHNVCDVCLEMCHSQYKLSNHVWKHKLHHFCYRCGIAYRNKPDITRHLFWKHGTESVLCKKCLQKKWPHVYHFCVPPTSFTCEECNLVLSRAVSLKVHKRLHTEEKKHPCTWEDCADSFVSKKLMLKHLKRHTEPPEEIKEEVKEEAEDKESEALEEEKGKEEPEEPEETPKLVKPKVDVYDLPELNLSESDTSDSETEPEKSKTEDSSSNQPSAENTQDKPEGDSISNESQENIPADETPSIPLEPQPCDLPPQPIVDEASSTVMQNIWDNFKNYQANKEKLDHMLIGDVETKIDQPYVPDIPIPVVEEGITWELALRDHDYCIDPEKTQGSDTIIEVKPSLESTESIDHDYCFQTEKAKPEPVAAVPPPQESPNREETKKSPSRKRTSSSSSSSTGSDSSCACGSDCSCSDSSSGSSSSSSDSSNSDSSTEEGRKKQQQRRLKRKEKTKVLKKRRAQTEPEAKVDVVTSDQPPVVETPIRESDLETTESETDEEFYDREPQKFAKKILEEKRALLLAEMGPNMVPNGSFIESTSRPPTPPAGTVEEEEEQPKKKKKTKKRKKRRTERREHPEIRTYSATLIMDSEPIVPVPPPAIPYYQQFHQTLDRQSPTVAPITLSLRNSPVPTPGTPPLFTSMESHSLSRQDSTASDSSVRASKRRRVPNKFYGYSSDEDGDRPQSLKRSKVENNRTIPAPASPMLVPPITIKTVPTPTAVPPRPPMVEPLTLRLPRPLHPPNDFKSHRKPMIPPIRLAPPRPPPPPASKDDSATESNESDNDEPAAPPPMAEPPKPPQPQLYCYCRCPYDEVSEMIGCDSHDCQIEWFHFECVGIMVPPKGQWFCPDCRKRKQQQRRDMLV